MTINQKIDKLLEHITLVRENCVKLGKKIIDEGDIDRGIRLITNGLKHDSSKFDSIEFDYLWPDSYGTDDFKKAINIHHMRNSHHPEYWENGINEMGFVSLAECVCDWKARSSEFGESLREWINTTVAAKFKPNEKTLAQIHRFVDMLCDKPFTKVADVQGQQAEGNTKEVPCSEVQADKQVNREVVGFVPRLRSL